MRLVHAPFDADQIVSINSFQQSGVMHPFTCPVDGHEHPLEADSAGVHCVEFGCEYRQGWVHSYMADGLWKRLDAAIRDALPFRPVEDARPL